MSFKKARDCFKKAAEYFEVIREPGDGTEAETVAILL
jgi:hypothetical protein